MTKYSIFLFSSIIVICLSCSKKATLYEDYWETREAGAYKFTDAKISTYTDGNFVSDSIIPIGDSYILLYTTSVDGFFNELKIFGDWTLPVFGSSNFPKAWNMENDDKRITFSVLDGSGYYTPISTLTIEKVGDKKQKWNYVVNSGTTYHHYTFSLERTKKP